MSAPAMKSSLAEAMTTPFTASSAIALSTSSRNPAIVVSFITLTGRSGMFHLITAMPSLSIPVSNMAGVLFGGLAQAGRTIGMRG